MTAPAAPPHPPPARRTSSPNAWTALGLGVAGPIVAFAGLLVYSVAVSAVGVLFAIAAVVLSIVSFARDEPRRVVAGVGMLLGGLMLAVPLLAYLVVELLP